MTLPGLKILLAGARRVTSTEFVGLFERYKDPSRNPFGVLPSDEYERFTAAPCEYLAAETSEAFAAALFALAVSRGGSAAPTRTSRVNMAVPSLAGLGVRGAVHSLRRDERAHEVLLAIAAAHAGGDRRPWFEVRQDGGWLVGNATNGRLMQAIACIARMGLVDQERYLGATADAAWRVRLTALGAEVVREIERLGDRTEEEILQIWGST